MTFFPDYLKNYPNMHTTSPLHIGLNRLSDGFRAHRHDFLEFSYVLEGNGDESINGIRHEMGPGTFTFVLPDQVHELFTAPGSTLVLFNCMFSMEMLMDVGNPEALLRLIDRGDGRNGGRAGAGEGVGVKSAVVDNTGDKDSPFVQLHGDDNDRMRALIEDLHREYTRDEPWRATMLQLRLKEILIAFDRIRKTAASAMYPTWIPAAEPTSESSQTFAARTASAPRAAADWPALLYIHQNYRREDLALSDLAAHLTMSLSRASEVVKETTGQNFVHLLRDLRVRHACGLLASTRMSVARVALEVGFGSYQTFSRVFRETKGMGPKEYRKLKTLGD